MPSSCHSEVVKVQTPDASEGEDRHSSLVALTSAAVVGGA